MRWRYSSKLQEKPWFTLKNPTISLKIVPDYAKLEEKAIFRPKLTTKLALVQLEKLTGFEKQKNALEIFI